MTRKDYSFTHLFVSGFDSPSELDNYTYFTNGIASISVHDGILDLSVNANIQGVSVPVMVKQMFSGSGIRVKTRIDAKTNVSERYTYYSLIIASDSNYNPNDPLSSDNVLVFGYIQPYLYYAEYWDAVNDVVIYNEGSWNSGETGCHTFEVALHPDRIELYLDGKLVNTYNSNPFASGQVHIGIIFLPFASRTSVYVNAFLHVDWLVVDPVEAPPGDPPDIKSVSCGGLSNVASSVMESLAGVLEDTASFISKNVNTIAGVVFASGLTLTLYKNSRIITSAVIRILEH